MFAEKALIVYQTFHEVKHKTFLSLPSRRTELLIFHNSKIKQGSLKEEKTTNETLHFYSKVM